MPLRKNQKEMRSVGLCRRSTTADGRVDSAVVTTRYCTSDFCVSLPECRCASCQRDGHRSNRHLVRAWPMLHRVFPTGCRSTDFHTSRRFSTLQGRPRASPRSVSINLRVEVIPHRSRVPTARLAGSWQGRPTVSRLHNQSLQFRRQGAEVEGRCRASHWRN
jgi:hypothetical protein